MEEYASSATLLIDHIDCTAEGKELCSRHAITGYPSILYGDTEDLQTYEGGRSTEELIAFAKDLASTPRPRKTEFDRLLVKLKKLAKPLVKDVEHILQFRKNAVALLIGVGALLGMVLQCLLCRCCCGSRSGAPAAKGKKDN
mmetsp:Transcript_11584/g.41321  ORF Transcript_11584/g.41321 Transcript_11584/m.41321 type:complete len:142 (+) Transcript_11584:270-695(+)